MNRRNGACHWLDWFQRDAQIWGLNNCGELKVLSHFNHHWPSLPACWVFTFLSAFPPHQWEKLIAKCGLHFLWCTLGLLPAFLPVSPNLGVGTPGGNVPGPFCLKGSGLGIDSGITGVLLGILSCPSPRKHWQWSQRLSRMLRTTALRHTLTFWKEYCIVGFELSPQWPTETSTCLLGEEKKETPVSSFATDLLQATLGTLSTEGCGTKALAESSLPLVVLLLRNDTPAHNYRLVLNDGRRSFTSEYLKARFKHIWPSFLHVGTIKSIRQSFTSYTQSN